VNLETIQLKHGSGTGLSQLLSEIVLPSLALDTSASPLEDAAVIQQQNGLLAFTTDSFVVYPRRFPGGNIGKLAACGTINDLAMMGATPLYISVSLILEEGLAVDELREYLQSLQKICFEAGVTIVCGDTKVVNRGKADGVFINTSGIGSVKKGMQLSAGNAQAGDVVIVSGAIAKHGIAIMSQREGLNFASEIESDCAPLHCAASALLDAVPETRIMRDATRGGCSAVLNEIADDSQVTITIDEESLPVDPAVRSACDFLGLEPLHIANEGTFVAIVPQEQAQAALNALHDVSVSKDAVSIGSVGPRRRFGLTVKTSIGGTRPVEVPPGELLPRIC